MRLIKQTISIKAVTNMQTSVIAIRNSKKVTSDLLQAAIRNRVKSMSLITAKISNQIVNSSISKVIYLTSPVIPEMSVNFFFTNADLVNNKLTKYHGFNGSVDVSVFNDLNEEVEVSVDVSDPNRVTIDLGRLVVQNNWQIKIEK